MKTLATLLAALSLAAAPFRADAGGEKAPAPRSVRRRPPFSSTAGPGAAVGIATQTLRERGFAQIFDLRSYDLWVRSEPAPR